MSREILSAEAHKTTVKFGMDDFPAEPQSAIATGQYVFVFTDLVDSTRLTYTLPPEVWGPARDRFFALQLRIASRLNMVWLSPRGDGKFLVFSREIDAARFAGALLATLGSMDWGEVPIDVRIGIASGVAEWLATETGGVHNDFVGTPLNLAARICATARAGEALASSDVCRVAKEHPTDGEVAIEFTDLGEVELKGLPSERVYRIVAPGLRQDFPPLALRGNLDQYQVHSSYFGRHEMVAQTQNALVERQPVLTLLGDPGLGKTRLSLEVGQQSRDRFLDGVWFIPLEHVRQGDLVAETIVDSLGLAAQPGKKSTDVLATHLKTRHVLLILDNCEQLLMDEDDEGLLDIVESIVRACPKVRILATSRQPLELGPALERILRVTDLPLPPEEADDDPHQMMQYASAQLLCDRLSLASGGQFRLTPETAAYVGSICRALDGIPLYLELAAGQIGRARTLPQIAADVYGMLQTRDRTFADRQRTLDKLLDFSCDHMPEERDFYYRLGVFAGSFTAVDAAKICEEAHAEEYLQTLVIRSLVKSSAVEDMLTKTPRYRLLQAPAAYGRRRLGDDLATWQKHHAFYFCDFAQARDAQLKGPKQKQAAEEMAQALTNLRIGMDWALSTGEDALVASYGEALSRFLFNRGLSLEGRERVAAAMAAARRAADTGALACALSWAATFERQRGDATAARRAEEEALELWTQIGDSSGKAGSLYSLSLSATNTDAKQSMLDHALTLYRDLSDTWGEANCLYSLGNLARSRGNPNLADDYYQQALQLRQKIGDRRGIGNSLASLGILAFTRSDYDTARDYYEQALAIKRDLAERNNEAWGLYALGMIAQTMGQIDSARNLYAQGLTIYQSLGLQSKEAECLQRLAELAVDSKDSVRARQFADQALSLYQALDDPRGVAAAYSRLASAALIEGKLTEASDICNQALNLQRELASTADIASSLHSLGLIRRSQGNLPEAKRCFAESLQILHGKHNLHGVAMVLGGMGIIARDTGALETAYLLAKATSATFTELKISPEMDDHREAQELAEAVAANLLPEQRTALQTRSETQTLDETVEMALTWAHSAPESF